MDPKLLNRLKEKAVPMNSQVCNGFSHSQSHLVMERVNSLMLVIAKMFPPCLEYCGIRKLSPDEEFNLIVNRTASSKIKKAVEISRSDIFTTELMFKFNGKPVTPAVTLKLPFIRAGNIFNLNGTGWTANIVLSDPCISVGLSDIFVRLTRARLTFRKDIHHIILNNNNYNAQYIYSNIYNYNKKNAPNQRVLVRGKTSTGHYMFCKYGFLQSMALFGDVKGDDIIVTDNQNASLESYRESNEWDIYESSGVKPKSCFKGIYEKPSIIVLIKKNKNSLFAETLVTSLLYIADYFPGRIKAEYINKSSLKHETRMWMILLGYLNVISEDNEAKLYDLMEAHMHSLDSYVDALVIEKFKESHQYPELLFVTDIYQLFGFITKNINNILQHSFSKASSIWNKDLEVLYYLLYDIQYAIVNIQFKLQALMKKKAVLTIDDVFKNCINLLIRDGIVYTLGSGKNQALTNLSMVNPNLAFKTTTKMIPQTDLANTGNSKIVTSDPNQCLHASVAAVGSFLTAPKSSPSGRAMINPYIVTRNNSIVHEDHPHIELLNRVEKMIQRT